MSPERRDRQRIIVGPDHTIRFHVKDQDFPNVRITNLSPGGCFATVLGAHALLFSPGTLLEHFAFEHPDLPQAPFTAQVAYTLGDGSEDGADLDYMGLGIRFVAPPTEVEAGLQRLLRRLEA